MIVALSAGRDAPAEMRFRLALDEDAQWKLLTGPRPGVAELVALSTCHRTEMYATGDGTEADVVHAVAAVMPGLLPTDQNDMRFMQGADAIEHLFRVAAGLDSLVVGETQVLGQVRRALAMAQKAGAAGPVLSNIFGRALRLGRRVRAETALGKLAGSIGSIAAEYAAGRLGSLEGRPAVVVGTGEAARDAARGLWKQGADLTIVGRTPESAAEMASQLEARAEPIDSLYDVVGKSHAAVFAVGGGVILRPGNLAPRQEELLILDVSVPPAVDSEHIPGWIELRTLEDIPGPRGPEITDAVIDAEAIVKKEVADLQQWADTRASGGVIAELQGYADELVRNEVEKGTSGLDLSPEHVERIQAVARRIAAKLLHGPTSELRRSDEATRALIRRIFRLDA
ncbi:MAG: glutamyl-tRNA reductase [Actinomycetota bacterium]